MSAQREMSLDEYLKSKKEVMPDHHRVMVEYKTLHEDAERYRRLCVLVEAGEWFAGYGEIINSYGALNDTFMDDKAMMDEWLDRPDVVQSADEWRHAMDFHGDREVEK